MLGWFVVESVGVVFILDDCGCDALGEPGSTMCEFVVVGVILGACFLCPSIGAAAAVLCVCVLLFFSKRRSNS